MDVSVIVPTRDRPHKLAGLIRCLTGQRTALAFELIVVDDGSRPPVVVPVDERCRLVRLEGSERSVARNAGARTARGELLVFVDDDLTLAEDFVEQHWAAFREWPDALLVGDIRLPDGVAAAPFGRFRAALEAQHVPSRRGPVARRNFCTAANLSVGRRTFEGLGGFDAAMTSAEDQDLALRHAARGGRVAFVPEAAAVHHDDALDVGSYGLRAERGAAALGPFLERYPELPDNVERLRVNGPLRLGRDPVLTSLRKVLKALLASDATMPRLLSLIGWLEKTTPDGRLLPRLYRLVLGARLQRGFRRSLPATRSERSEENPSFRRAS